MGNGQAAVECTTCRMKPSNNERSPGAQNTHVMATACPISDAQGAVFIASRLVDWSLLIG
jgi:hypothetical protein